VATFYTKSLHHAFAGSIANYCALAVEILTGFVMSVLLVKALAVEDFAGYRLMGSILLTGTLLTSCGLDSTLQRYGAEFVSRRDWRRMFLLNRWITLVRALALLAFCAPLLAFRDEIGGFFRFPGSLTELLPLVCVVLLLQSNNSLWGQTFFLVRSEFVELNACRIATALLKLAGLYVVLRWSLGLFGVVASLIVVFGLFTSYYAVQNLRWARGLRRDSSPATADHAAYTGRVKRYAFFAYLSLNVNVFRDLSIDSFVISHYLLARDVALYGLASTLILFAANLNPAAALRSIANQLFIARYIEERKDSLLIAGHTFLMKTVIVFYFPVLTLLILFGDTIIELFYTPDYVDAYTAVIYLSACYYLFGLTYPFALLISVQEKNIVMVLSGLLSLYNLAMDIVLVPLYGMAGAAIATGSAGILHLGLYWLAFRGFYKLRIRFPLAAVARCGVNLAPAIIVSWHLKLRIGNIAELAGVLTLFGLLYAAMSYTNRIFDPAELAMIRRAVLKRG